MKYFIFSLIFLFSFITINAQVNLEEGLIAHYPFSENADDASGNNHHGAVTGAILTEDKDGNPNSAFAFDGEDDFIQIADHEDLRLGGNEYTISLWFYLEDYSNPEAYAFLSKRNGFNQNGYQLHVNGYDHQSNATLGTPFLITSGGPNIGSQTVLEVQNWYHMVVVGNSSTNTTEMYIDCELDTQKPFFSLNPNTTSDLFIGLDELTESMTIPCCDGYHYHGVMDEIRFYNRALNIEEIRALCQQNFTDTEDLFSKIKIFPNPVKNTLFIQTENVDIEEMILVNLSGQKIFQGKFQNEIDVNGLTSGIYFLQLKNKNGVVIKTEKVIIINKSRA